MNNRIQLRDPLDNNQTNNWSIDPAKCNGCGDCVIICPVKALKMVQRVAAMDDEASCCLASCRICELQCGQGAIKVCME
jgi:formate hydrogenlyase subunit 6/NADH:ubiquinone oxidoreductase subunit I